MKSWVYLAVVTVYACFFSIGQCPACALSIDSVLRSSLSSIQTHIVTSSAGKVLNLGIIEDRINSVRSTADLIMDPYLSTLKTVSVAIMDGIIDSTGLSPAEVTMLLVAQGGFVGASLLVGSIILVASSTDAGFETPYEVGSTTYDVRKADDFYNARPGLVFSRLAQLAFLTSAFNLKLLIDWQTGRLDKNEKMRAKEALVLSTQLGPTFIKLGQALSIRTDLIPEAYALELRQLQDAVPPFDSVEAKTILKDELRVSDLREVFTVISEEPIASASIGQVYRAKLKDGRDVAVKVQRPRILGEIALDLYILRLLTPLQVKISNFVGKRSTSQEDIDVALSLVDEWGRGFVAEVDYRTEAKNTMVQ